MRCFIVYCIILTSYCYRVSGYRLVAGPVYGPVVAASTTTGASAGARIPAIQGPRLPPLPSAAAAPPVALAPGLACAALPAPGLRGRASPHARTGPRQDGSHNARARCRGAVRRLCRATWLCMSPAALQHWSGPCQRGPRRGAIPSLRYTTGASPTLS